MNRFFCITVSFTVFLLHGFLVFPQTKIIIYNSNAVQKENKIFVANLIKSFHNQAFKYEINDETSNINELLKAQGYKIRKQEVSDSTIATACEKFETDYLMRFTLYPQKTIRNVRVSLINGNTFAVEKTKTFTCNNLKNKTEVKKITDDIAANFLNANEENDTNEIAENTAADTIQTSKRKMLNGHYLSLGSGLLSPGYYGLIGIGYEYRHGIFGVNVAVGSALNFMTLRNNDGINVNVGCKFYLSNRVRFVRNLYFNVIPFCYFGNELWNAGWNTSYTKGDNYNIIITDEIKYEKNYLFGAKIFFGYSPVWRVGKKVSLGFNIDIGYDIEYYKSRYRYIKDDILGIPISWDFGFIIKLNKWR